MKILHNTIGKVTYIVKLFLKVLAMLFQLEHLHLLLALIATLVVVVGGGEGWQGCWTSGG